MITVGELRRGLAILPACKRRSELERWLENDLIPLFSGRILLVTQTIAERWGVLSGQRQLAGRPLSMGDGLIAATAAEHRLTVATRDARGYANLGVAVLNPWETRPDARVPPR